MKAARIAAALALAAALSGCGADDPVALLASARHYLNQRDFSASIIQLKNVLQKAPDHGEARYLLGRALLEQGDAVAAQIELDKAAQLGLASDGLQLARARATLARGQADKVLERFGAAALSTPAAQAELRALVGMAHLARRQMHEAERAFGQATKLNAADVTANLGSARLAAAQENFPAALTRLERALAAAPDNLEALLLKADVLAAQRRLDDAETAFRAAVNAAPKHPEPRLALIVHLLRRGALDKAEAEAAALYQASPRDPRTAYARALVLGEQQQFAQARQAIQHVLKAAPEHVPSLTLAGLAALRTGALQEAESHLRKALFNEPRALAARRLLAMTLLRMGRIDLALGELEPLLKLGPDPSLLALAGEAHLANGDVAAATRHYEQARALAPNSAAVQTRLALIRFAAGEPERGIRELEAASAGDASAYQADLELIASHLRRHEADRALQAVRTLENKQPAHPMTHNLKGGALLLKGELAAARASFERALELQPGYLPALGNLALLDVRERKPETAKSRYEALLRKEPGNEQALLGLARLLRVTGASAQEIEKPLRLSVATHPTSAGARLALVDFYAHARDFKAALAGAQAADAALPNNAALVQALGKAQVAAGEPRQAIATFTRLATLLPKSPEPRVLLARAHVAAGQPRDAIRWLRAALGLNPDLPAVQREIAALYVSTGRHSDALREAKALQAKHPGRPLGHVLEGEIYLAQKDLELAERTYRAALKRFDLPALALGAHAVLEAAGKRSEARSLAEDWLKRHPQDTTLLAYLGERDIAARRYESAAARFQSALERLPDNAPFLNNLAWVSHELQRPKALEYAERAHELAPDSPAVMDTLGTILADGGQLERGLELLGRAAQLAPEAHRIRLNFARALLKAERKPAARKELENLARLDPRLPAQREAVKLLATF